MEGKDIKNDKKDYPCKQKACAHAKNGKCQLNTIVLDENTDKCLFDTSGK